MPQVVVEGDKAALEALVERVRAAAGDDAALRVSWQTPVGGLPSMMI